MRARIASQLFYKCLFKQAVIRGSDAGIEPVAGSVTKKSCTGRDCQQWTVGAWSKVRFVPVESRSSICLVDKTM